MNAIARHRHDGYGDAVLGGQGGVQNGMSGLGNRAMDRTAHNRQAFTFRSDWDLTKLYTTSGLAARIVDMPADDALARGFEIDGDADNLIMGELDRLSTTKHVTDGLRWSRLYGGSVIMLIADDGYLLPDALNVNGLQEIVELKVFDATDVWPSEFYLDENQPNYGMPSLYSVNSPAENISFRVHESRLIFFSGDPLPKRVARARHNGLLWRGKSMLEGCYDSVLRYDAALKWSERMLERKQQPVYTMEGLADLLINKMDDVVTARVNKVDLVRSLLNTVVIDGGKGGVGGDKYEVRDLNLAGVTDVMQQHQSAVCGDTGWPATVLFGRSPAGHNATGESDTESYYRIVGHIQNNDAQPAMSRLISLALAQKKFPGARPEKWELKFHPLWLPSEKDQAQAALWRGQGAQAEAAAASTYAEMQAITNRDVRADLQAKGQYLLDTDVDTSAEAAEYAEET